MKSNADKVEQAVRLKAEGKTVVEIAESIGVSPTYARLLANPEAYAQHKLKVAGWNRANPEKHGQWVREYNKRPHVKDAKNARFRERYATDPEYRKKRHAYTKRFSLSNLGRLRHAIRVMTWGLFVGEVTSNRKLAELGMGKPLDEIRATSGDGDSTDHIVPLCQFNLWEPVQLLQAIHWSNIRRVPLSQNREKGYKRANVDISSLPYVNTPEAIQAAQDVIDRHKYKAAQNPGPIKLRSAKAIPGLDFVRLA